MTDEVARAEEEKLYSVEWIKAHKEESAALINAALDLDAWNQTAQVFLNKLSVRNEAITQSVVTDINNRLNELTMSHVALISILTEAGILRSVPDDVPSEVLN